MLMMGDTWLRLERCTWQVCGEGEVGSGERRMRRQWLMPELARMTFFSVMGVVVCVKDGLVIIDTT